MYDSPLLFTVDDIPAGNGTVAYQSWQDEEVVISGHRSIQGFKRQHDHIWTTTLSDVYEGKWYFRQLFADG